MILKFMFPKNYFQGERDNPPSTITPLDIYLPTNSPQDSYSPDNYPPCQLPPRQLPPGQ